MSSQSVLQCTHDGDLAIKMKRRLNDIEDNFPKFGDCCSVEWLFEIYNSSFRNGEADNFLKCPRTTSRHIWQ